MSGAQTGSCVPLPLLIVQLIFHQDRTLEV